MWKKKQMNVLNLGLSHVMPWGIRELLLSKTVKMNVNRNQRVRVYQAIKNFLGEDLSANLPAVVCRSVLIAVLNDKVSMQALSALSSMAFVVSDAILCCMDASGWGAHPLYDEIMSGLVAINQKMMKGRKAFEYQRQQQHNRKKSFQKRKAKGRRHRRQQPHHRKGFKKKIMKITTDKEEFSILVCGDGDSCKACKFLLKKIGDRDRITMDTLAELVGNITDIALQL